MLQLARALEASQHPLPESLREWESQERQLADLRESYNRHASVWNDLQSSFPHGLFVRALTPETLPLWEGV